MENNLRVLRAERKVTQFTVSKGAGISRTCYNNIENGKSVPDGKTIAALVSYFKVPANEIFFDLDVVSKQPKKEE